VEDEVEEGVLVVAHLEVIPRLAITVVGSATLAETAQAAREAELRREAEVEAEVEEYKNASIAAKRVTSVENVISLSVKLATIVERRAISPVTALMRPQHELFMPAKYRGAIPFDIFYQ